MIEYILILIMVALTVVAQLLIKKAALSLEMEKSYKVFLTSFFNKYLITAAVIIFFAPLFYLTALSRLDLTVAFSFTGLNYVFVVLGAKAVFKERINNYHLFGIACIFAGIAIFNI